MPAATAVAKCIVTRSVSSSSVIASASTRIPSPVMTQAASTSSSMALQTTSVVSVSTVRTTAAVPVKVAEPRSGSRRRSYRMGWMPAGRRYGSTTEGSSNDGEEAVGSRSVTAAA